MNDKQSPGKYLHQDRVYWALAQGSLCVFWVPAGPCARRANRELSPQRCAEINYYRFNLTDNPYSPERTDLLFD